MTLRGVALWNHRPANFRAGVELTTTATLLVGNNLLWLTIPGRTTGPSGDAGEVSHGCVNISFDP